MDSLINTAITKRKHLLTPETDALRLLDGSGDGLNDTFLETFADHWIISTRDKRLPRDVEIFLRSSGKTVYWKQLDQHQKENPIQYTFTVKKYLFLNHRYYSATFKKDANKRACLPKARRQVSFL